MLFLLKMCLLVAYRKKLILWPFTYWYDTYICIDLNKDVASNFGIFHWEMSQNFLCLFQFIWDAVTVILYMSCDLVADWCSERFTVSVMQRTNVKLKIKVALKSTSSSPQSPWFCMDTKMPLMEMWFIFYSSECIFKCENVHICDVAILWVQII